MGTTWHPGAVSSAWDYENESEYGKLRKSEEGSRVLESFTVEPVRPHILSVMVRLADGVVLEESIMLC